MADETAAPTKGDTSGGQKDKLLTLTEVSKQTGISMPTLQRYKKNYQDRIPSKGRGRRQRYPKEALDVFRQIKKENIKRRGRPPKKKGAVAGRAKKAKPTGKKGLLTLTKVAEETGISYPTLVRYVKLHEDRIPHEGKGRSRRYYPEAVGVFKQIRAESPRGRRPKKKTGAAKPAPRRATASADAGLARRVESLERAQGNLEKQIKELIKQLRKPLKVTINR
jgi:predicted DNA-binding transcriptional regulator AlpA